MQGLAKKFKTRTLIKDKKMPKIMGNNQYKTKTIVGLDIGYSSIKGVGGDRVCCFPSIIKKVRELHILGELKPTDIILTDNKTGDIYYIGEFAYEKMTSADIKQLNDAILYDRYWFTTELYGILAAAGIALGLPNNYENTDIYLQTGLPCSFIQDAEELKRTLMHTYDVTLQIGNEKQKRFTFSPKDVFVMEQPMGTLYNALYNQKAELIPERKSLMSATTVIHDVGFNSEDDYSISGNTRNFHETYLDTSMRAVFDAVLAEANRRLPNPIQSFELQKYLETGVIRYHDRATHSNEELEIENLLTKYNEKLNQKAVDRLMRLCDDFVDVQNLIVTGGTGESRIPYLQEQFANLGVNIIPGNENDTSLPYSFSNVLGYYKRAYNKLRREA